jgi:hypothetical protein
VGLVGDAHLARHGVYVPLAHTIDSYAALLAADADALPVEALHYTGPLSGT